MLKTVRLSPILLAMFDGEGGGEGDGGQAATVVYGADAPRTAAAGEEGSNAGGEETKTTPEKPGDRNTAFEGLIGKDGEYRDLYEDRVQKALSRRLSKAEASAAKQYQPLMDMLSGRYGTTDVTQLAEAMEKDDAYWKDAAEEAGMTVEQYKQFQRLKAQNERFLTQQQEMERSAYAQQQVAKWETEAEALKEQYPGFDLRSEADSNQTFMTMLQAGATVQNAYESTHLEEIKNGVAQRSAQDAEKKTVDNIRARGARPTESASNAAPGVVFKRDLTKLTRADREEIARRAANGEKFYF